MLTLLGGSALAAHGAAPSATAQAPKKPLRAVKFRMNWTYYGMHAPFFLAKVKGYYEAEGLDVELLEGAGSVKTLQLVANRSEEFGFVDSATMIVHASQGVPVKAVFTPMNSLGVAAVCAADKGIKHIKDLEGKTVAVTAGDSLTQIFPAVVSANKLDQKKIKQVFVDANAKPAVVMEGKADCLLGAIDGQPLQMEKRGFKTVSLKFADYGLKGPQISIIVHRDASKDGVEAIRGLVAATQKGWQDAHKDPEAAVAAMIKALGRGDQELWTRQLQVDLSLLYSEGSKGKPIGWSDPAEWDAYVELLKAYRDLKTDKKAEFFTTNEFLPG